MADKPKPFPTLTASDSDERTRVVFMMNDEIESVSFELQTQSVGGGVQHRSEVGINISNWGVLMQIHRRLGEAIEQFNEGVRS